MSADKCGVLLMGVFGEEMAARGGGQLCLFGGRTPDPAEGGVWLGFTRDHDEADAAASFLRRYGQPPRYIFDSLGGLLLVGPVEVTR